MEPSAAELKGTTEYPSPRVGSQESQSAPVAFGARDPVAALDRTNDTPPFTPQTIGVNFNNRHDLARRKRAVFLSDNDGGAL